MKEQFCTYEIALKLKELGFDEECFAYYNYEEDFYLCDNVKMIKYAHKYHKEDESVLAPLWQQAIDWLREEKNIQIHIGSTDLKIFTYDIVGEGEMGLCEFLFCSQSTNHPYDSYYEAREQAVLKAIELCQKEK